MMKFSPVYVYLGLHFCLNVELEKPDMKLVVCVINYILAYIGVLTELRLSGQSHVYTSVVV